MATASVRPAVSLSTLIALKIHRSYIRCAIASFARDHRPSLGRLCSGQPLTERLCALYPLASAYDSLLRLRDEPPFSRATVLRPLAPTNYHATAPCLVGRTVPYVPQAGNGHLCEQRERNAWSDGGNRPGVCRDRSEHGRAKVELAGILDLQQGYDAEGWTPGPPTCRC